VSITSKLKVIFLSPGGDGLFYFRLPLDAARQVDVTPQNIGPYLTLITVWPKQFHMEHLRYHRSVRSDLVTYDSLQRE